MGGGYSYGQSNEKPKISYGVKAGINLASFRMSSEARSQIKEAGGKTRPLVSFHIGGYVDFPVSNTFSVQGGLTLSGKGDKERYLYDDDFAYPGSSGGEAFDIQKVMYLEIPVNAIYKTGRFYMGAGPYVGYALSGKWIEKGTNNTDDADSYYDSGNIAFGEYFKRTDFGINFLAGYQLKNKINLGIGYGLGLSNNSNDDDYNWSPKNRVFSLSVGYSFGK
jgi:hypothetical protein